MNFIRPWLQHWDVKTSCRVNNFIAHSNKEYIELAKSLAYNFDILEKLRFKLREKLIGSPLCQGESYAQFIESTYQTMWKNLCSEYS